MNTAQNKVQISGLRLEEAAGPVRFIGKLLIVLTILCILQEVLREDGPSDRCLMALEEEEKRQHWSLKYGGRRRVSEVIGVNFPSDSPFRRYLGMGRDKFFRLFVQSHL